MIKNYNFGIGKTYKRSTVESGSWFSQNKRLSGKKKRKSNTMPLVLKSSGADLEMQQTSETKINCGEKNCKIGPIVGGYVRCQTCQTCFHYDCAGIREAAFKKLAMERRQQWKCQKCRVNPSPSEEKNELMFEEGNVTLQNIGEKLGDLCRHMNELTKALEFQSARYDKLFEALEQERARNKEHEKKITKLENENKQLVEKLNETEHHVNNLDQYGRNRNIEIHGVQERVGEDLKQLVIEMGKLLNIDCCEKDIDVVHRVPARQPNKRKAIIVQFTTRTCRDVWLKKRITGLVSNNLISGSDDEGLFINVNLSAYNRELAWKARVFAKRYRYKFCWVNGNGNIFLRKSEESQIVNIKNETDIPRPTNVNNNMVRNN